MDSIKHAFGIGGPQQSEPNEKQKIIVDKVCKEVVNRKLSMPALIMLETFRPLNYIGSQVMHFFKPIVSSVLTGDGYSEFSSFLEERGSVDYICKRINDIETEKLKPKKQI